VPASRTDTVLPPGFDLVVLGAKEIERVRSVQRNPDRKEADVDGNGDVSNNQLFE